MKWMAWLIIAVLMIVPAHAETVDVKYIGAVELDGFQCENITRSSLVNRICHDLASGRLVLLLRKTYYQYCGVDAGTADALSNAPSIGRFYNRNIKSSAVAGRFDC